MTWIPLKHLPVLLWTLAASLGLFLIALTTWLVADLIRHTAAWTPAHRLSLPDYDYEPWREVPAWDGRMKPLETAAEEIVRQITGTARFEDITATALVLHWLLGEAEAEWEQRPFILCDHHELRRTIFGHRDDGEQHFTGKYVSPEDLRISPGFAALLAEVARQRSAIGGKAAQRLTQAHLKAEEVAKRLSLYDALRGRNWTALSSHGLVRGGFVNLADLADPDEDATTALQRLEARQPLAGNPVRIVCLGGVPGNGWFSVDDLRRFLDDPRRWRAALEQQLQENPLAFLPPDLSADAESFREAVTAGRRPEGLETLPELLAERRRQAAQRILQVPNSEDLPRVAAEAVRTAGERDAVTRALQQAQSDRLDFEARRMLLVKRLEEALSETDRQALAELEQQMLRSLNRPAGPELDLLTLRYLELRYPRLYSGLTEVALPTAAIEQVLHAWESLRSAYASGNRDAFRQATEHFLGVLNEVADADRMAEAQRWIPWELLLNRLRPFRWAWLMMLAAVAAFAVQINTGWKWPYRLGWLALLAGLTVQAFGFVLRIMVAGRAPVGNMYETVIFVAFLASLFAVVLELLCRRTVIVLAGAGVSALGLMLADQLPLALDPRISPLAPVLRSNFWLTVHVVTIVASYAGATLAWGLGNVSLALLAFGRPQQDTLKTLATYTYRAMQIAVVLLALGTVLGAWWASEAWGRYWGWDPKETGAVIALLGYVIPLHARYAGWIREFGLAVSAVLCYAGIILSWYVINFVIAAGLHSYGFSGGGGWWVLWAGLLNLEWLLIASGIYLKRSVVSSEPIT
jgi:ABC-type transport system involved in cytochrome c biogenesis permease subunit